MFAPVEVERRMASTPSYGSYVSALNKKPPPPKDTNRWVQSSPHSSIPPPSSSSSSSSTQPHQKQQQQPHLFHTNSISSSSSNNNPQTTGIYASTSTTATTIQSCDNGTSDYTSNHQHRHQKQQHTAALSMAAAAATTNPSSTSTTGFGMNTGTVVSVNDGGWSRGMPEKGSGWRNLSMMAAAGGATTPGPKDGSNWGSETNNPSPSDVGSSGWDASSGSSSLEKSGSGWGSADGWGSKSSRQAPPAQRGAWDKGGEGSLQEVPVKQGVFSHEEKQGHESGGVNGMSMWGPNREAMGSNWKPADNSAGNDANYSTAPPPSEDRPGMGPNGRRHEGDFDRTSSSSNEQNQGFSHSQESYRGVNASPAAYGASDTVSLGSSGHSGDYHSSGNFTGSHDSHVVGSDEADNTRGGFESPYSRISPRNGAGTPVQLGGRSGGATPTQGSRDKGENAWSGRVGSTSSVSSVGSGSSWKGGDGKNGGYPTRSNSPRKNSLRFDRGHHHDDGSSGGGHTPVSMSSSYGNGIGIGKNFPRKSKKMADYEEGLGSLQSAPSGWGELPSPKFTDLDNGTEFWGIPPADLERQGREKAKVNRSSSSTIQSGDMGWLDGSPPEVDWVPEDLGAWGGGGGGGGGGPASGSLDQGPSSWGSFNKDKMAFVDNVMQLMNMGMNRSSAEKLLGSTNNNLEMAILMASGGEEAGFDMATSSSGAMPPSISPRKPPHGGHGTGKGVVVTPTYGGGLGQDLVGPMNAMQASQMLPPPQQQQQVKSQSQLKLLQMQQQYLLGPGGAPNQPLNLQNYLQVVNQRYIKLQKNKQVLAQQLKMSGGDGTVAHQIKLKLQRVQHLMLEIEQQRLVMGHLPPNQQEGGGGSLKSQQDPLVSPMMQMGMPSSRGSKGFGGKQGGRSHSTSGILEEEGKGLSYNIQGLSLGATVSQSSARSVSRFHQIFSGSSSDNLMGLGVAGGEGQDMMMSGGSQGSSPFSPPQVSPAFPTRSGIGESLSGASTPSGSASFLPSGGKQFTEIQEFRPGVPWQPRSQATEPAQLYSKQVSMPAGGMMYGGLGESYNPQMAPSPVFTNLHSPMLGGGTSAPSKSFAPPKSFAGGSGMGGVPTHKYGRSNSIGSGFYGSSGYGGNTGNGSGFMNSKRLPSPSPAKYSQYPETARQPFGQGGGVGGWGGSATGSGLSSDGSYGGVQARTTYPNTGHSAVSPISMAASSQFPPGSAGGMGDRTSSWRTNKQQNAGGRRIVPPSSLPPRSRGSGSRSMGTPHGTRELFDSNLSSDNSWGALSMTPGALTPGLSNPVWGSTPLATPDDPTIALPPNQWGKDDVSKIWDQTSRPDSFSSAPSKPPGLLVNPDPSAPPYMKTPASEHSGKGAGSFPSTPSFSSGSSTWGQDEIRAADVQKDTMSPEPTFAEWLSGKKARLLPNATSPWLVIRNINAQIDSASLRDVCCEYGTVRVCHTHYQSELALICFSSIDEAVQAKTGLDKNPSISGVTVSAQFASEANIKELCERLQVGINSEKQNQQQQHRGWPNDARAESTEVTSVGPHKTSLSLSDAVSSATGRQTQWDGHTPSSTPFSRQTSEMSMTSTPGSSSMWSDGGFLSGFSSPWLSSGPVSSTSMGSAGGGGGVSVTPSEPCSMTPPQDTTTIGNFALPSNCANGQSFLPGGIL